MSLEPGELIGCILIKMKCFMMSLIPGELIVCAHMNMKYFDDVTGS